ncbi:MAG TPA: GNAT family N-acetyltransferase [Candidatus Obscuribacterales bacterium]
MIKIEPLFATDYAQVRGLMKYQTAPTPAEHLCESTSLFFKGLTFWQHWLPCHMHITSSVYVAKEDGVILGLIALRSAAKSKQTWQVDHLIVHPHHRGRGIAQELLRYAFALFGSQGASHFVCEVSVHNSAALQLFGSCGFRRLTKVTHYQAELPPQPGGEEPMVETGFRPAIPPDKHALFQLHQEVLPADIRHVFSLSPDDFNVSELPFDRLPKLTQKANRRKCWFWISRDSERKVITSAVKVTAHREGDYHLEFAVHPGWTDLADSLVAFALDRLRTASGSSYVSARVFDFQPAVSEALQAHGMERAGEFCLLAREHWVRAKQPSKLRLERSGVIPSMNMPLATERGQLHRWRRGDLS